MMKKVHISNTVSIQNTVSWQCKVQHKVCQRTGQGPHITHMPHTYSYAYIYIAPWSNGQLPRYCQPSPLTFPGSWPFAQNSKDTVLTNFKSVQNTF